MNHAFNDHFAAVAASYADFRPTYPVALFGWLAEIAPARDFAWDCATGSGQAARGLAGHFRRVVATDASAAQIDAAAWKPPGLCRSCSATCAAGRRARQRPDGQLGGRTHAVVGGCAPQTACGVAAIRSSG